MKPPLKLKLLSCEVLFREMCAAVARSPHQVDVEFLSKGLHDLGGAKMSRRLQERIDQTGEGYDAILLGYALCGNGLMGLTARHTRLVVARAHDCIALLMGSRRRFQDYFDNNPGTFFRSTGWLERGKSLKQLELSGSGAGNDVTYEEMVKRYGEENAQFLMEELTRYHSHYQKLTYIETGLEPDGRFVEEARAEAVQKGWDFEKISGSLSLFEKLVRGEWDEEDFLVVEAGQRIGVTYDDNIIRQEKLPS